MILANEDSKDEPQGSPETATTLKLEELTYARQAQPEATNAADNEVSTAPEVEQTSSKPADEVATTARPTTATIVITRPPKPTKKPKPVKATTVAPVSEL